MLKTTLLAAVAALGIAATPAAAQTKETRVSTPVVVRTVTVEKPVYVDRVVVREVPAVVPARANDRFVGLRAGVNAGVEHIGDDEDFTYGATVGGDLALGSRATLGADLDLQRPFDNDRQLGAGVRVGYALSDQTLAFARVGYARADFNDGIRELDLDGLTYGGGLEFATGRNTFVSTEYRYTDYNHGYGSHGARIGFGVRF